MFVYMVLLWTQTWTFIIKNTSK